MIIYHSSINENGLFGWISFLQHPEFSSLLKEKVCALAIKLFSPNVKCQHRIGQQQQQPLTTLDKPFFPVSMRLLRLVSVLVQKYYSLLVRWFDCILMNETYWINELVCYFSLRLQNVKYSCRSSSNFWILINHRGSGLWLWKSFTVCWPSHY